MTTYRQRWKYHQTGTPASIAHHAAIRAAETMPPAPPTLASRMSQAAWDAVFGRTEAEREAAIVALAGLVQEAHEAGLMIDVTHNRDDLRRDSSKHCIVFHLRRPGQPEDVPATRVFLRTVTRTTHDAIMPRVRKMFVEEVPA
jgi:hypothetical protein